MPASEGYRIELTDGSGNTRTLTDSAINSVDPVREHTAISDWKATVAGDTSLEEWRFAQAMVYYESEFLFQGYLEVIETSEKGAETTLSGRGIAKDLLDSTLKVSYSKIEGWEAIDDFWTNHTGFAATVTKPDPNDTITDQTLQQASTTSEFQDITSLSGTDPFTISNGTLQLDQTCFFQEGESNDSNGHGGTVTEGTASDGAAASMFDTAHNPTYNFTLDYDIPEQYVGAAVRFRAVDDPDNDGYYEIPGFEVTIDDNPTGISYGACAQLGTDSYQWQKGAGWASGNLTAGQHTVKVNVTSGCTVDSTNTAFYLDGVVLYDTRFNYTFDNSVDADGYLSGPELYPDAAIVNFNTAEQAYNITEGHITSTWDDVSGNQGLGQSADGGSTYVTASNTQTQDATFSAATTTLDVRAQVSRYGSRSTATPTQGFNGQTISSWELSIDGNDLGVIDQGEFEGDALEILQDMHERSNMRFTILHQEDGSKQAESYGTDQAAKAADWDTIDRTRKVDVTGYANRVVVKGAKKGDGTRYSETVNDQDEIDALGETITHLEIDPKLQTVEDCRSRARTLISELVGEDSLSGSVEITPQLVDPGYSYTIEEWGETLPLESVNYSEGPGEASGTLEFEATEGLASTFTSVRKSNSEIRKQQG